MIAGLFIECVRVAVFLGVVTLVVAPLIYLVDKVTDRDEK